MSSALTTDSGVVARASCGLSLLLLVACSGNDDRASQAPDEPASGAAVSVFREVANDSGIRFQHISGATGKYFFPEINGAGAALLDYDGDGDLDVYLLQGGMIDPDATLADLWRSPAPEATPGNRLLRNELVPTGTLSFSDVTQDAGVGDNGYAMGVASGDIDNDGDVDLYVMNYGANVLYRNDGNGRFSDVTVASGTGYEGWSASGSFCDYDRDGDLDLFVANYLVFAVQGNKPCVANGGQRDYCAPSAYPADSDRLYRNDGNGEFSDVSAAAGIGALTGPGLGVTCADLNGDDWSDFYVANDQHANHLWINAHDGTFEETGLMSGAAYNGTGAAEASMGITAGDYDGDGDDDLFMTHLNTESNTLYVNDGNGNFHDATDAANLGATSLMYTGFGSAWLDYDNDSDLDLFVTNGAVMANLEMRNLSDFPYEQRDQLFENRGDGRFAEIPGAGVTSEVVAVGRGAAFGDIDNDGDVDILVANNNGPTQLLLNDLGARNHWLRVVLEGQRSNRDGQGARLMVQRSDGRMLWRRAHGDGSYASANDVRVLFGLGNDRSVASVLVVWPTGLRERWPVASVDGEIRLVEGSGTPVE